MPAAIKIASLLVDIGNSTSVTTGETLLGSPSNWRIPFASVVVVLAYLPAHGKQTSLRKCPSRQNAMQLYPILLV